MPEEGLLGAPSASRPSLRSRPSFAARAAEPARLNIQSHNQRNSSPNGWQERPYAPQVSSSPESMQHGFAANLMRRYNSLRKVQDNKGINKDLGVSADIEAQPEVNRGRPSLRSRFRRPSNTLDMSESLDQRKGADANVSQAPQKLGTFSGVFVPTTLNVLSILMFLRFGFILGQGGVMGMMGMLVASYTINLITTMSISAIATNGTVRGGGAYYLISRSLGPEFGGSIGMVFYMGFVFNTGMNAVGLIDCFREAFGEISGSWASFLPEGFWWDYTWATIILVLCTSICLAGSSMFSRASNGLLALLLISTFSIPFSAVAMKPFVNDSLGIRFTGISWKTLKGNLWPKLTKGAAGSQIHGKETFQDLFGILFPATGGIFAGASMSGDLQNPSKSIPRGTLQGLGLTFVTYTIVILAMAATITRSSFYVDANVIQDTSIFQGLILLGEFASTFFSCLMGVLGSAKLLQAIARDSLLPGLSIFSNGTAKNDDPINATIFTFLITQISMLLDINSLASFITMTYLMTFLVTNLACFLLKIGSAPNFRPSFRYFNSWTAFVGTVTSGATMFFVDRFNAAGSVVILVILFVLIHYTSPPKSWGDVSQSLIYHQVRKYLLRLKPEHVKFWRPQILLFVHDYETQYKMISFCNSLKKGGLFVLGRVIVTEDFAGTVPRARREYQSWTKFVEATKVKAFVNISIAPTAEWGIRNLTLTAGLGGMRPNIVVLDQFRDDVPTISSPLTKVTARSHHSNDAFECTDSDGPSPRSYLTTLEDLLYNLRINVAVARGFEALEMPSERCAESREKPFIDLWPIQISAEINDDAGGNSQNVSATNFDTYTLILQLGCILNTVPSWKKFYKLRVVMFVEYEDDHDEEFGRAKALLEKLRIQAEVLVFWLDDGDLQSYSYIVNGNRTNIDAATIKHIDAILGEEGWWRGMRDLRSGHRSRMSQRIRSLSNAGATGQGRRRATTNSQLRQLFESPRKSISGRSISYNMQAHHLDDSYVESPFHPQDASSSEEESDDDDTESYHDDSDEWETDDFDVHSGAMTGSSLPIDIMNRPYHFRDEFSPIRLTEPVFTSGLDTQDTNSTSSYAPSATSGPSNQQPNPEPTTASEVGTSNNGAENGPSITFAPSSSANHSKTTHSFPDNVPLSFNDLPSRAQYLILNELMRRNTTNTAVVFTTLPSPVHGTKNDPDECKAYLSELDIFCKDLPPCLLVHSNSTTVTMNL